MTICNYCRKSSTTIAGELQTCVDCIRKSGDGDISPVKSVHIRSRRQFGLPDAPPRDPAGKLCRLCVNECSIPRDGHGFCGVRRYENGRIAGVSAERANVSWYLDPLPTNCVADWICPAGTDAGYPAYSYSRGPEYGYKNLAVFFQACSMNCLYCQNWHFRQESLRSAGATVDDLLQAVTAQTACVCYFGGDPTPQLPYALKASKEMLKHKRNKHFRVCWETNGTMHPRLLDKMMDLSLQSGGIIKFDLKAWSDNVHRALTGVTNKRTLENFRYAARRIHQRADPPLLTANTLLVPGYVDEEEVRNIARFVASCDKSIPYSLLAFYPNFYLPDLPTTSRAFAYRAYKIARDEGLKKVRIGNKHLLL
jgi:pyruvate formate lyase activating enzyme